MKSTFKLFKTSMLFLLLISKVSEAQIEPKLIPQKPKAGQVLQPMFALRTQKGANVFNTGFASNATGRNDKNAFLLAYLSTAIYADKILEVESPTVAPSNLAAAGELLQVNSNAFVQKFRQVVSPYFSTTTQYTGNDMQFFESKFSFDGYDPEAMIIPAENSIFITFRGTDKVAQRDPKNTFDYETKEWLLTDFQALKLNPGRINNNPTPGQALVHQGMWLSLLKIADTMARRIVQLGGANKKVWITGHSLGGGLAQLFAYFLAKGYNIKPQGIYTYASPQIGNASFNTDFITTIGGEGKLQRFEFMDDPITVFAQVIGFQPAGIRNSFTNINNLTYDDAERSNGEILRIAGSAPTALTAITPFGLGGICFHQQGWYMQATYKQLTDSEKESVPFPTKLPDRSFMGCGSGFDISRATGNNPVGNALNTFVDLTDRLINTIGVVAQNITGTALVTGTGTYKITCLKDGKNLAAQGTSGQDGKPLILWQEDGGNNMRFEVFKKGAAYGLKMRGTNKVLDVKDGSNNNGARIQIWENNLTSLPFQNNQIWYFYNVGGNRYVLQNEKSKKVLDADNPRTNTNGCEVMQWDYQHNALNQVWVFEKVN
ncbi:MAG: RICIN domain-containing protein [Chitinophagaceae bacterium]